MRWGGDRLGRGDEIKNGSRSMHRVWREGWGKER